MILKKIIKRNLLNFNDKESIRYLFVIQFKFYYIKCNIYCNILKIYSILNYIK